MRWAALYACVLIPSALAQGSTQVEPKHYQLVLENEYVQVVNLHYGPHEKSTLHHHPGGVVVVPTSGHLKFTDEKANSERYTPGPASAGGFWHPSTK
jgi:quercetin dioxygenase-like cupin family protein